MYLWVPFSYLELGDKFEPIDALYGYAPLCTKVKENEGVGVTHLGRRVYTIEPEESVRIAALQEVNDNDFEWII